MGWKRPLLAGESSLLLSASASGRYFVDAQNVPFLVHGDTAWSLFAQLSLTDATTYLEDCRTRGFNAVIANAIEHLYSSNAPENINGDAPFTGIAFQSSLNSAYWDHLESILNVALNKGIVVFIDISYWGFGGSEGWQTEIGNASSGQLQSFGASVGTILKDYDNIVYHDFGDNGPGVGSINADMADIHTGLISTDTRHTLFSHHYFPDTSAHTSPRSYMTYDFVYETGGTTHADVLAGYNDAVGPVVLGESQYEQENGGATTPLIVRRQAWGAMLYGAFGQFCGHRNIWAFGENSLSGQTDTWQNTINNVGNIADGRVHMAHMKSFLAARSWWLLVPDQTSTFVTAGRGSGTSFVPAAFASDDSWGAAYLPTGSSGGAITIDRTEFSGAFSWNWYNPRTGGTSGGASGQPNTGTANFTAPDTNDWVWVGEVD